MKRIIKRIVAGSLLSFFVFVCGLGSIMFFPEPLFAYEHAYKTFSVYSDEPVNPALDVVLDDVVRRAKVSELYDSTFKVDVFLSFGHVFNTIEDRVLGHGPSARVTDNNIVVKVQVMLNVVWHFLHSTTAARQT